MSRIAVLSALAICFGVAGIIYSHSDAVVALCAAETVLGCFGMYIAWRADR